MCTIDTHSSSAPKFNVAQRCKRHYLIAWLCHHYVVYFVFLNVEHSVLFFAILTPKGAQENPRFSDCYLISEHGHVLR